MSQENIDRFLEATEAFNRLGETTASADPADLMGLLRLMDPEIHFEPQQALLQGRYVLMSQLKDYGDKDLALEAAGLSE